MFLGSKIFEPRFLPADVITLSRQGGEFQVVWTRKLASIDNST